MAEGAAVRAATRVTAELASKIPSHSISYRRLARFGGKSASRRGCRRGAERNPRSFVEQGRWNG
jgi:hypothetical protein